TSDTPPATGAVLDGAVPEVVVVAGPVVDDSVVDDSGVEETVEAEVLVGVVDGETDSGAANTIPRASPNSNQPL
ncbi:MAG: hypothetical protein ACRBK7_33170, partial [Acidimicrobiales bacterium]